MEASISGTRARDHHQIGAAGRELRHTPVAFPYPPFDPVPHHRRTHFSTHSYAQPRATIGLRVNFCAPQSKEKIARTRHTATPFLNRDILRSAGQSLLARELLLPRRR